MNNEWHPFPEGANPSGANTPDDAVPSASTPAAYPGAPTPADSYGQPEQTRILPPTAPTHGSPHAAPDATHRRGAGALSTAVLAGALVLGGAAGVGGAAAYDAMHGSSSTTTDNAGTSPGDLSAQGSGTTTDAGSVSGGVAGVAAKVLPSVVQVNVVGKDEQATGSGIILTSDGTILTNNHVAAAIKGGAMSVRFNDGKVANAKVVGTDPVTDLAVIKAENVSGLRAASLGKSSDLKIGEQVVAIGSPEGLSATVTSGIVSALNRAVSIDSSQQSTPSDPFGLGGQQQQGSSSTTTTYPAIQTDAPINEGNSGGPLVNMAGQVVGINSAIKTAQGSSGSIGIGFAIPMDEALPIVNQLRDGQTPTHARLGISVQTSTSSSGTEQGAVVKSLEKGEAADKAGLKDGDVITKVDGQVIETADDLVATIRGHRPGDTVTLTVIRDGKEQQIQATLGSDENAASS